MTRIDAAKRKVVATIKVGESPVNPDVVGGDGSRRRQHAVVAPVDGEVWASMYDAGEVWRIRPG